MRKLLREGNLHWLPVYALVMQSDLGQEGIINSGSYRFADHIYRKQPSGRGPFGRWIDALFLAMPAAWPFHRRCKRCQDAGRKQHSRSGAIRVLAGRREGTLKPLPACGGFFEPHGVVETARSKL